MAKMIKFDLLVDGSKVKTFEELQDSLHADLLGYLKSGKLAKWFLSRELEDKAEMTQAIDVNQSDLALMVALCEVLELEADEDILADILEQSAEIAKIQQIEMQQIEMVTPLVTNVVSEVVEEVHLPVVVLPAPSVDWSGEDFSNRHFDGEDLRNANLEGINLTGATLKGANLSGANLKNSILDNAIFTGANLSNANLEGASISNTCFGADDSYVQKIMDDRIKLIELEEDIEMLNENDIKELLKTFGGYFYGNFETVTNMTGINLKKTSGTECCLVLCNLANANISYAEIGADFSLSKLTTANLSNVTFYKTLKFQRKRQNSFGDEDYFQTFSSSFLGCDLTEANFTKSDLEGCKFSLEHDDDKIQKYLFNTKLIHTNFSFANLTNAMLVKASCTWENVRLTGAIGYQG